jgi:hypothetical protein
MANYAHAPASDAHEKIRRMAVKAGVSGIMPLLPAQSLIATLPRAFVAIMPCPQPHKISTEELLMKRVMSLIGVFVMAGFVLAAPVQEKKPPSDEAIETAQRTTDLLQATLFAALLQEFAETTPENVPEGIQSIGLVFNDKNSNMRLVGTNQPLSNNDLPQDTFEGTALANALRGQSTTEVQKVEGEWVYRRSIPLSNFHPACEMCHPNFGPVTPSPQWVGALMLKVPIEE